MDSKISNKISKFNKDIESLIKKEVELESRRKEFVNDYNFHRIKSLSLKEYCIGYKNEFPNNADKYRTFCYRLEIDLKPLGDIRYITGSRKFGVYRQNKKFVTNIKTKSPQKTLNEIKGDIIKLLNACLNDDNDVIEQIKINSLYKYKLINVYYPNKYLNIYSGPDIEKILSKLKIEHNKKDTFLEKQRLLMNWKNTNKITKGWSNYIFMVFLYREIIKKKKIKEKENNKNYEEDYDRSIQSAINKTDLKKFNNNKDKNENKEPIKIQKNGIIVYYKRDINNSIKALINADYGCECSCGRKLFKRKKDRTNYVEAHHLVPMRAQKDFKKISLDTPDNIVSLCSSCHNEIHYGKNSEKLLMKIYKKRKKKLKKLGVEIGFNELIKYYQD